MKKAIKSGAQKRREKKVAKLQEAATQFYSLENHFSCATTSETESSPEFDSEVEELKRDEESYGNFLMND